jgi:IS4 transposase
MFRSAKAAIKLHTLLDLRGNIPTFIHISDGKVHEVNILDQLLPEPGAFYIMDRGFLDFERLYRFHEAGSFFVTRGKSNLKVQRRYSHPVDRTTGLMCDQSVVLTGFYSRQGFEAPLRRIRFKDPETAKTLKFLTNNFALPAFTIAQIYKCRWQVELFFESSTWCTPSYVMEFQEAFALNQPLLGALPGSVRPNIVQRLLCA